MTGLAQSMRVQRGVQRDLMQRAWGNASRPCRLFPIGLSIDELIRPVPPSVSLSKADGVEACAAASAAPLFGATEPADAAAALSELGAGDRTRMVEAVGRIIEQRHRQLDYGHTLDRDLAREDGEGHLLALSMREGRLIRDALRDAGYAQEDITLRVGGRDWMDWAARRAAKSAALLLAFIELMLERQAQRDLEPEPAPIEQGELGL